MDISRRGLLAGAVATAGTAALGASRVTKQSAPRSLRIAFVTDVHLDDNASCEKGFARCLSKIENLKDKPDFIIQGGDIIYDGLTRELANVAAQYARADRTIKNNTSLRVEHVLGNHDIWGWLRADTALIKADGRYGKGWWRNWSGQAPYRSFDSHGWHFIVLDSMMPHRSHGYVGKLDDAQFDWLARDLERTNDNTPICIVSHIPILSTSAMMFGDSDKRGRWEVPGWLMHIDARRIKNLLIKHPNVKTCLSGHIHMHSRADYNGVKHIGFGAVSGAWWRGSMQETPPGFGIVDFFADGMLKHFYVTY